MTVTPRINPVVISGGAEGRCQASNRTNSATPNSSLVDEAVVEAQVDREDRLRDALDVEFGPSVDPGLVPA